MNEAVTQLKRKRSTNIAFSLLVIAALLFLGVQRFWPITSAVAWQTDLSAAQAGAMESGKPMLLSFTSKACIYCRKMEAEVMPQEQVLAEINKFVPVKIDANANAELSARYNIGALPAYIIADASGEEHLAVAGYLPAEHFIRFLKAGHEAAVKAKPSQ